MIDGVRIKELRIWPDKVDPGEQVARPGFLTEVLREDEGLLRHFGQTTMTLAHPGTVKAFHWHQRQDDLWFVATGQALIVLHDLRDSSSTKGETQTILAGAGDYKLVVIPVGVAHGYKVLGSEPVILIYHTTEAYNASTPDEERVPADDPGIGFDWSRTS